MSRLSSIERICHNADPASCSLKLCHDLYMHDDNSRALYSLFPNCPTLLQLDFISVCRCSPLLPLWVFSERLPGQTLLCNQRLNVPHINLSPGPNGQSFPSVNVVTVSAASLAIEIKVSMSSLDKKPNREQIVAR